MPIARVYGFSFLREGAPADWLLGHYVRKREVCLLYEFATAVVFFFPRNITHTPRTHFPCLIAAFLQATAFKRLQLEDVIFLH